LPVKFVYSVELENNSVLNYVVNNWVWMFLNYLTNQTALKKMSVYQNVFDFAKLYNVLNGDD